MMWRSLLCLCLLCGYGTAQDLGVYGTTYPIAETDMRVAITQRLSAMMAGGLWQTQKTRIIHRVLQHAEAPVPVSGIHETTHESVHFFDPSVKLVHDIKTAKGRVVVPAGTVINPLSTVSLPKPLIFVVGGEKNGWARTVVRETAGNVIIVLVRGDLQVTEKALHHRVYFDQGGELVKKFKIQQVPAIVSQEGLRLRVHEVMP